ncbi:MAG: hypothetical protein AB7F28_07330 [Candidatus Margulisiibacteriota bacterium]
MMHKLISLAFSSDVAEPLSLAALSQLVLAQQNRLAVLEQQLVQEATHDNVISAAKILMRTCVQTQFQPQFALTEGSGVDVSSLGQEVFRLDLDELGYPRSEVSGHEKRFVRGLMIEGKHVLVLPRFHPYEKKENQAYAVDNALRKNTFGARLASLVGVETMVFTTACGVIYSREQDGQSDLPVQLGNVFSIDQFVTVGQTFGVLDPSEVLKGFYAKGVAASSEWGSQLKAPRSDRNYFDSFPQPDKDLSAQARQAPTLDAKVAIRHIQTPGPNYEERGVKQALMVYARPGQPVAVSMSTQSEAIAAGFLGIKTVAFGIATNIEYGDAEHKAPNHAEVKEQVGHASSRLNIILAEFFKGAAGPVKT